MPSEYRWAFFGHVACKERYHSGATTHQTEITTFTTTTETVVMATTLIYGVDGSVLHAYVSQARQPRP